MVYSQGALNAIKFKFTITRLEVVPRYRDPQLQVTENHYGL